MEKNSRVQIYGVLGYPAKHSLSPLMHNAAFKAQGINAEYKIFQKAPEELESFLNSLAEENIRGLNITVPYKEKVIPFLDEISDEAKIIAAVNTIKVSGNALEGFNTDGEGFMESLCQDLGFDPSGKEVFIIGAGGAARAVTVYLSRKKPRRVYIYDIDKPKVEKLVNHLQNNFKDTDFKATDSIDQAAISCSDLLVNASPVGMKESDSCLINEKQIHKGLLVYDLIYNPPETKLLKLAKEKGLKASNGLNMLLYQGMLSFKIWTGYDAPEDIMLKALKEGLENV